MTVPEDTIVRNRALQTEWYGEPLGDRVRRLLDRLGLSQSGLAGVLGLSPPMLSQLMSAQRAKISNPVVLNRLLAAEELACGPEFDALPAAEVKERLRTIRAEVAATTSGVRMATSDQASNARPVAVGAAAGASGGGRPAAGPAGESTARQVQALLREVASATEIEAAAGLIDTDFPELAEILRIYGNGRTSEAEAHFLRTLGR
ncbi:MULTISPECIES: helix-turn-helix domain-containing protein [Thermomonosporaceae]|uniref:helix-turn-helix domain-containing protein n=1 Tax=Thermomonosporaceae TaxID=2012 RepID=UPI00255ABAD7|nr:MULTISPECIES: helix-turn-helix transcriptional regulator [Thermomonosporaceae]MDL4772194.1 helix-turn-helix transcriptional regulator [Actinomadura xylanilytica]